MTEMAMDDDIAVPEEREPPLYFAGREAELEALDLKLARLCRTGDPSAGLRLTVGVPGIGKTQLAAEFLSRVQSTAVHDRKVATLQITTESLNSPVDLFIAMAQALDEDEQGERAAQHDDRVSGATIGALGVRGALAMDIARHTPDLPGLLRQSLRNGMWSGKTLALAVDEIQRIDQRGMDALHLLHSGVHECPIMLMGFGLQHTERRLAKPPGGGQGISRVAAPSILKPLDETDACDAFSGNLRVLGYDDIPNASIVSLAGASCGFPQHINGYLEGAHAALKRYGHLEGASLDSALQHGHARRTTYYNKRLSAGRSHAPMRALFASLEANGIASIPYPDAQHALESAGFTQDDLDSAIEHGSLTHDDTDNLSFGIPSFYNHMAAIQDA